MPHSQRKSRPMENEQTYSFVCVETCELRSYCSKSFAKKAHLIHKKYCEKCSKIEKVTDWNINDISSHLHLQMKIGQSSRHLNYNHINTETDKVFAN
jgi:hypothetical protein